MNVKLPLLLIATSLTTQLKANEILASKEGAFTRFNRCTLMSHQVSIQIDLGMGNKVIETTPVDIDSDAIKNLSKIAIANISQPTYRWSPVQTDYLSIDENNGLTTFYAHGFRNIQNSSDESIQLIKIIDEACDQQANDFKIIGNFDLFLKIGNRTFNDKVEIDRKQNSATSRVSLTGKYTVPSSFESKIESINYINGKFSFTIHVIEGKDDYKAVFEGEFKSSDSFIGQAFILPERKPLGVFNAQRISP